MRKQRSRDPSIKRRMYPCAVKLNVLNKISVSTSGIEFDMDLAGIEAHVDLLVNYISPRE